MHTNGRIKLLLVILGLILSFGTGYYTNRVADVRAGTTQEIRVEHLQREVETIRVEYARKELVQTSFQNIEARLNKLEEKLDRVLARMVR